MYDDERLMKGSARSKWPSLGIYPWSRVLTLGNTNGLVISKDQRGLLIRMYRKFDIAYVNGFVLGTPKFYIRYDFSIAYHHGTTILHIVAMHVYYHIEAETKWTPFRRRHFQTHFLDWKY